MVGSKDAQTVAQLVVATAVPWVEQWAACWAVPKVDWSVVLLVDQLVA